jgi:hypothetical protein
VNLPFAIAGYEGWRASLKMPPASYSAAGLKRLVQPTR